MANFTIKGDCDEVIAKLKKALEANDAKFNAQVEAIFKRTPKPAGKSAAAPKPASATAADRPYVSGGWGNSTSRKPSGSMRSRLRG